MKLLNHKFISGVENFSKQIEMAPHNEKARCKSQSPMLPHTNKQYNLSYVRLFNMSLSRKGSSKNNSISIVQPALVEDSYLDTAPKILITNISPLKEEDLRPVHKPKETISSVYTFEGLFPTDKLKATENANAKKKSSVPSEPAPEKKSEGSLQNLDKNKEAKSEEEVKYSQIPSVKTLTQTDGGSNPSSLNAIRSLTDGANTIKSIQEDAGMAKARPDMKNKQPRQRPLGSNKRLQFKTGSAYANLSEDESLTLTGMSFMLAGSPGAANETIEEQQPYPSSGRAGSHSNLLFPPTPNGGLGMFRNWPESVSQLEEQEGKDEKKEWEMGENGKIEEEEEKEESEKGEEKREERKSNNGRAGGKDRGRSQQNRLQVVENYNDISRMSARSNPEMSEVNFEEENSKKGRKSKESSALFRHDYVARDSLKRKTSLMKTHDGNKEKEEDDKENSKTSIEDALQLNQIQPDLAENRSNHFEGIAMSESQGRGNSSPSIIKTFSRQNSGYNNKNKYEMKENNEALEHQEKDKKKSK